MVVRTPRMSMYKRATVGEKQSADVASFPSSRQFALTSTERPEPNSIGGLLFLGQHLLVFFLDLNHNPYLAPRCLVTKITNINLLIFVKFSNLFNE